MQSLQFFLFLFAISASVVYSKSKFSYVSFDPNEGNIIEVAQSLGLKQFLVFANKTGLSKILTTEGPYTLFGPNDLAFLKTLPNNMKFMLEDSSILEGTVNFQVHPGKLESKDLKNDMVINTLTTGFDMRINVYNRSGSTVVTANCRTVSKPDQEASNGVIHVQDGLPFPAASSIMDMIKTQVELMTFQMMIDKAGLQGTFSAPGPLTVFAPTYDAFLKIPTIVFDRILNNPEVLKKILLYHVVSGTYCAAGLEDGMELLTLEGDKLHVSTFLGGVKVGKGIIDGISYMDFMFNNGVIHLVDNLILPFHV